MVQSSNYANPPLTDPKMLGTYAWWQAGTSWTNYQVSLTMKSLDNDAMGMMFRYQDPNNYYRFTWLNQDHSQGIGRRQLVKFQDGQFEVLAHDDVPYAVGQEYQVRITANGGSLRVYIDGQLALSGGDSSLQSGSVALYCWGNEGTYFDNIYLQNSTVVLCAGGLGSDTILDGFTITGGFGYDGGGMQNWESNPTVINCIFTANMARNGGGMCNYQSSPKLTNCIFIGNTAESGGGGILNYGSSPTVTNCTFNGNKANSGGGMYNYNNSSATVTNCIFWGNVEGEIYDSIGSSSNVNYCDVQGGWSGAGGNNIDADPCFVNAASGDLRLLSDLSPCVDAGDNGAPNLPATDITDNPRVVDGDRDGTETVDMGAFELQALEIHNITQDLWYDSIQVAIDDAYDGDQIEIGAGTYYEAINFNGQAIRLYSMGGPDVTTIDGTGAYNVVQCVSGENSNTIMDGFTITGGNAIGDGSGYPFNHTYYGGGMYNYSSSPTVINCIFTANMAYQGGGMYNHSSSPTVTNCKFSNNTVSAEGGGMYNGYGSSTVTNCIFIGNSADSSFGGGMFNYMGNHKITNCTFIGNVAGTNGGGMFNLNSSPTVTNCILWGDTPDEIYDTENSSSVNYCDIQGGWSGAGGNNIDADPCFVDASNSDPNLWNLRLKPDSPCIDAADSSILLTMSIYFDIDVKDRYVDIDSVENAGTGPLEFLDIGAYEFNCNYTGGDSNCDGVVDFKDLAILCNNWLSGAEP